MVISNALILFSQDAQRPSWPKSLRKTSAWVLRGRKCCKKKTPFVTSFKNDFFFQQFSLCLLQIQDEILTSWISHQPEVVSPTQLSSQLVVKPAAHFPEPAAAQVAAQAVLVPVLLNGLQEEPVADALLAAATREQRRRHLQDLVHRFPAQQSG